MAKSLPDSWAALAWALWSLTTSRCAGAAIQIGLWTRASSGWESPRCQDPGLSVAAIDARMQHLVAG